MSTRKRRNAADTFGMCFCDAVPGSERGDAFTWGKGERVSHPICVDCAIQVQADPDDRDHHSCDSYGLVVDTQAALTRFRVELGHLEGPVHLCVRCSPGGPATYWTRDLDDHLVTMPESR